MNSMIGFNPAAAAPTPIPVKPASEIGVSMILSSPYLSNNPFETLFEILRILVICIYVILFFDMNEFFFLHLFQGKLGRLTLYAPLYFPTSSPIKNTDGSLSISSSIAILNASLTVTCPYSLRIFFFFVFELM